MSLGLHVRGNGQSIGVVVGTPTSSPVCCLKSVSLWEVHEGHVVLYRTKAQGRAEAQP